jgi:Tfp pilus assembly PilM family ATPase
VPAFGLDTIDHTVPSQTITNVSVADPVTVRPTATQSDALTHDTENSPSKTVLGLGLDTIDHTLPSHTIVNVSNAEPVYE